MYKAITKFLKDGGKCLIVENGEPLGVFLSIEEYELLNLRAQRLETEPEIKPEAREEKTLFSEPSESAEPDKKTSEPAEPEPEGYFQEKPAINPIGEAMVKEMEYPEASADIADIGLADDITLEDLGIDENQY